MSSIIVNCGLPDPRIRHGGRLASSSASPLPLFDRLIALSIALMAFSRSAWDSKPSAAKAACKDQSLCQRGVLYDCGEGWYYLVLCRAHRFLVTLEFFIDAYRSFSLCGLEDGRGSVDEKTTFLSKSSGTHILGLFLGCLFPQPIDHDILPLLRCGQLFLGLLDDLLL